MVMHSTLAQDQFIKEMARKCLRNKIKRLFLTFPHQTPQCARSGHTVLQSHPESQNNI